MPEKSSDVINEIGQLKLEGIEDVRLQDVVIRERAGAHGVCELKLLLQKKMDSKKLPEMGMQKITLKKEDDIVFSGVVVRLSMSMDTDGRAFLHVVAKTFSGLMDIKRRTRTFQNPKKTLGDVLKAVAEEYKEPKSDLRAEKPETKLPDMLYQENETDWEFLCRLAEMLGLLLFVDAKTDMLRISLGASPFIQKGKTKAIKLISKEVPLLFCKRILENTDEKARSCYYAKSNMLTGDLTLGTGYECMQENQKQVVCESVLQNQEGLLQNHVVLVHKEGCRPSAWQECSHWNHSAMLTGKVLEAEEKGARIRVHFDCDKEQKKDEALWIPYENEMSNYLYALPDEGDPVFVYFQENGTMAAYGSVRDEAVVKNLSEYKTEDKIFSSQKHGWDFTANTMVLGAGKKEKSVVLEENQKDGILFQSKKDVIMQSSGDIVFQAAGGNGMDGQAKLAVKHGIGYGMYMATGGQPSTTMINPAPTMTGVTASSLKKGGAAKEKTELSELAKELDKLAKGKAEKKEEKKDAGGGKGGKAEVSADKGIVLKVKDSAIALDSGSVNLKTRTLFQIGYGSAMFGGKKGYGADSPKARSQEIKAEHGAEDRAKGKEGGAKKDDGKKISRGKIK